MRAITKDAFNAFKSNANWSRDNTYVQSDGSTTDLYLHSNKIATKDNATGTVKITTSGWNTPTTKERLKPFASVYTNKGDLYCNGMQWNGEWITVE